MTISALESYLDLLLTRARHGRKLGALAHCAYRDAEMINAIESDRSLPVATRKCLIRKYQASLGECLRLAAKHGKAQEIADVMSKRWPRQSNQEQVFNSYRTVLRREGRPPKLTQLLDEDLKGRKMRVNDEYRKKRDLVLREMARRFKLPITPASG
jgi:hypothetical protein